MRLNSVIALTLTLIFSTITQAQDDYAQPPTQAENSVVSDQPPPQPQFSQQELDQMLAPIALYPDALLSQVLMASTYPLEVVQAARWSRANPDLKGDQAVKSAQQNNWDPSVISLTAFPQILGMMDEKLDWTQRLGDAFLAQQPQVMDTVQGLRQKAMAAGNLQSNDQVQVNQQQQQGQPIIVIQEATPQVVYVPYYNPTLVYGPWWWDAYPPVYWNPWPGYYHRPGYNSGLYAGVGISVGGGFFFGNVDWHQRRVNVVNVNNYYYRNYYNTHPRPSVGGNSTPFPNRGAWQHDPDHRHGVPYANAALQQQFSRPANAAGLQRDNHNALQQNHAVNQQSPGGNPASNSSNLKPQDQPQVRPPQRNHPQTLPVRQPDQQPQFRPQVQQPSIQHSKPVQVRSEQIRPVEPRPQPPKIQQQRIDQPRNEASRPQQEQRHEGAGHKEGDEKPH